MNDPDRPGTPEHPDDDEETTRMSTADATATDRTTEYTAADTATTPDHTLYDPLPYGAGFATPQQYYGYGVAPEPATAQSTSIAVEKRERAGSPVLAVAGLLSLGIAVWALLGAPMITKPVMLAAGLVAAVLVGLVMVVRR